MTSVQTRERKAPILKERKESHWSHYTSDDWAYELCEFALWPHFYRRNQFFQEGRTDYLIARPDEIRCLSIVDPACGDGALLIEAMEWVAQAYQYSVATWHRDWLPIEKCRSIACETITGVDIDGKAIDAFINRLREIPGADPSMVDLYKGDALTSRFPRSGYDCVVTNPPFLGGGKISGKLGKDYLEKIKDLYCMKGHNADLSCYFLELSRRLLMSKNLDGDTGINGTIGAITTKTVFQGDSREAWIDRVRDQYPGAIYRLYHSEPWPGEASVECARFWLGFGDRSWKGERWVDGAKEGLWTSDGLYGSSS